MPSRIPFSSPNDRLLSSRRGSGKLESGPARPCRTSKLFRFCSRGDMYWLPDVDAWSSSMGERGGELKTPGGNGRGPRRITFSRLCSWACWWRMVCLSVDI